MVERRGGVRQNYLQIALTQITAKTQPLIRTVQIEFEGEFLPRCHQQHAVAAINRPILKILQWTHYGKSNLQSYEKILSQTNDLSADYCILKRLKFNYYE